MNARKSPRRILLIRNDRVGDLVLTLPAIELLRQQFPDAHLTVLASRYAGPLLAGHPAVNELIFDDPAHSAWQLGQRLRQLRFDTVLVINTTTRNCLAVRFARIRRRVCWGYKPVGWLSSTHPVKLHRSRPPVHEAAFALAFVRQLGVSAPSEIPLPQLAIDAAAHARVAERIVRELGSEGPLFGVHPGNKNSAYNWPPACYAQLVSRLAEHGRVMLTGGPEERALLEAVCPPTSAVQRQRVGVYSDLSLSELVAAIALQDTLVVSSTGPMHLAGVVGTPAVALFSPNPAHVPAKWAPLGGPHTLLVAPLAPGENADVPRERGAELMARIGVDDVVAAALAHARQNHRTRAAELMSTAPTENLRVPRAAIFLDRDGTLNVDTGYTHRPADLQLIEGVVPGLQKLQQLGYPLFILTNQSGVARGYFTEAQLQVFHAALLERLQAQGVRIAGIYYCPFHPTLGTTAYRRESGLRKPRPGMFLQAATEHRLDLAASVAIGDKKSDVLAGQAAGCRTILLATGHGGSGEPELAANPDFHAANLLEAAAWIEQKSTRATGISQLADYAYPPPQLDGASRSGDAV